MRTFLFCLLLLLSFHASAQKKRAVEKVWTEIYSKESGKICAKGYLINGLKEGVWIEWESLGMPPGITKWNTFDEAHQQKLFSDSLIPDFYFTGNYTHGRREGLWTLSYQISFKFNSSSYEYVYTIMYQQGKKHGKFKKINTNKEVRYQGVFIDTLMIEEGLYQNDQRIGNWIIYSDFGTGTRQKCTQTL